MNNKKRRKPKPPVSISVDAHPPKQEGPHPAKDEGLCGLFRQGQEIPALALFALLLPLRPPRTLLSLCVGELGAKLRFQIHLKKESHVSPSLCRTRRKPNGPALAQTILSGVIADFHVGMPSKRQMIRHVSRSCVKPT